MDQLQIERQSFWHNALTLAKGWMRKRHRQNGSKTLQSGQPAWDRFSTATRQSFICRKGPINRVPLTNVTDNIDVSDQPQIVHSEPEPLASRQPPHSPTMFFGQTICPCSTNVPNPSGEQPVRCLPSHLTVESEIGTDTQKGNHVASTTVATSESQHPAALDIKSASSFTASSWKPVQDRNNTNLLRVGRQFLDIRSYNSHGVLEEFNDYLDRKLDRKHNLQQLLQTSAPIKQELAYPIVASQGLDTISIKPKEHVSHISRTTGGIESATDLTRDTSRGLQQSSSLFEDNAVAQTRLNCRVVDDLNDGFVQTLLEYNQWHSQRQADIEKNEQHQRDEEHQPQQPESEEKQQRQSERTKPIEEADRKPRHIDCAVCREEYNTDDLYLFPCTHSYCPTCLTRTIEHAIKAKVAFKCCKNDLDFTTATQSVPQHILNRYAAVTEELDTPHPTYCSKRFCSTFIPRNAIKGGTATCPKCLALTCSSCKKGSHRGVCKKDKEGQALVQLGNDRLWKKCPKCGHLIERTEGCSSMICRCGQHFCYSCGRSTSRCNRLVCRRRR